MLDRWQIIPQSAMPNIQLGGNYVVTQKTPVDAQIDCRFAIGAGGSGSTGGPNAWTTNANPTAY